MPEEIKTGASDTINDAAPLSNAVGTIQTPPDLSQLATESKTLADSTKAPEPQYVTLEQHQAVLTQLNQLTAAFNALTERFTQLVEIHANQQVTLTQLVQNQVRLAGEPTVKAVVPLHPQSGTLVAGSINPLQAITHGHLQPPPGLKKVAAATAKATEPASNHLPPGLGSAMRVTGN